jgi:hypothetical protein
MATVRKWEGRLIVTGDTTNIPPFHSHRMTLVVTPEEAITLARTMRDAADPWSEEACIEWISENDEKCSFDWMDGEVWRVIAHRTWHYTEQWPDIITGLRECVHGVAACRGIPCPLGDLCKVCHPPVPPVPSDEELARMGTEELIRWIEESGMRMHNSRFSVHRNGFNMSAWSVLTAAGRCEGIHASSTLLGLAKIVAAQLREAKPDA